MNSLCMSIYIIYMCISLLTFTPLYSLFHFHTIKYTYFMCTLSNPHVQKEALDYGALELLCRFISANEPDLVQRRGLFALSALMRGNTHPQLTFLQKCHGLRQLADDFHNRSPQTQLKAVTLLTDLLHEQVSYHL